MSKTKRVVRLAILGTGRMADFHAERFREVPNCQIVAAVDVDQARAEAFCKQHGIPAAYTSLEDVLARPISTRSATSLRTLSTLHFRSSACKPASTSFVKSRWR